MAVAPSWTSWITGASDSLRTQSLTDVVARGAAADGVAGGSTTAPASRTAAEPPPPCGHRRDLPPRRTSLRSRTVERRSTFAQVVGALASPVMSLYDELTAAAAGRPPEPDGSVGCCRRTVRRPRVVAFSAHFVVCADVDPDWVAESCRRATTPPRTAPGSSSRWPTGSARTSARWTSCSREPPDPAGDAGLDLEEIEARDHPRVVRALRYREDVRVWRTPDGGGHVLIGRGLAGRWEMAFEVEPPARGAGLGRRLAAAAAGAGARRRAHLGAGLPRPPGVAARRARRRLPPGLRRGPAPAPARDPGRGRPALAGSTGPGSAPGTSPSSARAWSGQPLQTQICGLSPCGGSGGPSAAPASP